MVKKSKESKQPFSIKINFEINTNTIKGFFKKFKKTIFLISSGGIIAHGSFNLDIYFNFFKSIISFLENLMR